MPENTSTMPEPMDNSEDSQQPMNPAYSAATLSAEEEKDLEVYECLTNIINELEPHALLEQIVKIKTLPIDSVPKMQDIIDLIFDKVAEEPDSCRLCAEACKELKQLYAYDENTKGIWTFEELLTDKCRQQLEYFENIESTDVINEEAICIVIGSQQKEKIQELYKEKVDKKKCWITSCKFASELFKLDMLSAKITLQFLSKLMHPLRDQTLQCLCELLLMIGKKLEFRLFSDADKEAFEELFHSMSLIWKDEELKYKISPEVKCKLIEVITLKHHHWEISENKKNHSSAPPGISKNSVVTVTNTKEIPIIHAKIPKNQNKIPIMSLNMMKTENLSPTLLTEMKKLTENLTKACRYNNDFVEDENDTLLEIFLWEFVNQKKTLDSIIIWIDQNFENSLHNIELIRKLVTAITRIIYNEWSKSGIYGEEKDMIIEAIITRMNKLFELYIHTFDQEIISLLTVIKVVEDSGYPKDLAKNISEILLKFNLLSNDSFHTLYHRNCCVSYTNYTIEEVRGSLKNIEAPSTIIDGKECNEQSVRSSVFGSTEDVLPHSNVVLESDPKFDNDTFYSTAKSFEIIYNLFPKNTGKTIYRGTRYQGLSYIPFKRVDQLEYAANLIFKMMWENPLLLDDYSLICEAMRNISVGEKSFPIILNKELSVHLAEIMQSEDAYEGDDQHKHNTFYRFLVKLTKKQLIEEEKLVHFLKWLLEKNPDLFCEIYENMELRSNLPDRDLEESIHYKLSNDVDLDSSVRKRLKNISMFVSNRYRRFGIISKPTESSSQTFTVEDRSFKMDSEIKKLQENQSKLMEEVLKTREVAEKSSKKLDEIFNLLADLKKTNSRD